MNRFLFVGMLDSDEFALAMHLMNIKLDGQFIEDIHTNRRTDGQAEKLMVASHLKPSNGNDVMVATFF